MRSALLVLSVLACACGDNLAPRAVPLASGPASIVFADGALVFARGDQTLLTLHAESFEAGTVDDLDSGDSFDPYFVFTGMPPATLNWRIGNALRVQASTESELVLAVEADGVTAHLTIAPAAPGCFTLTFAATSSTSQAVAILRVRPDADATEAFYGLGEWGDSVDSRGKLRPMQMEADLDSESADDEAHAPVPLIVGTRGWGAFVPSDRAGAFDVARQSSTLIDIAFATAETSGDGLIVDLLSADQPIDVLREYFALAGAPGIPAPWAYGPLVWRDENSNQAQVIDDISQIRTRHLAASGIWFDRPYATGVETFDFDPAKFDDPPGMFAALHAAGLRFGVWHAPYVAPRRRDLDRRSGRRAQNELPRDGARSAARRPPGVLLRLAGCPPESTSRTKPRTRGGNRTSPRTRRPASRGSSSTTAKTSSSACSARARRGSSPTAATSARCIAAISCSICRTFIANSSPRSERRVDPRAHRPLGRSNARRDHLARRSRRDGRFRRTPALTPMAAGAASSTRRRAIKGLLSASGFAFYIGWAAAIARRGLRKCAGALGRSERGRDRDEHRRRLEHAAVGEPQRGSRDVRAVHRAAPRVISVRADVRATTSKPGPILQPMGSSIRPLNPFPSDEYLFGDSMLVAPVVTEGATSRTVWFPPGTWLDWWTGDAIAGGAQASVDADLATLPLYLQAGAIIPMLDPSIETLAPSTDGTRSFANDPGVLTVRVAPGSASSFTLYDGTELEQAPGSLAYRPDYGRRGAPVR